MKRGMHWLLAGIMALVVWSCQQGGGAQTSDCRYGKPAPIFSSDLVAVSAHQFEAEGQSGYEQVTFSGGQTLEILQSGCDHIRQEFRFHLPPAMETAAPDSVWLAQAVDAFFFLASAGPEYAPLSQWGQSLAQQGADFRLGKPYEVEPGFFGTVDRILSPEETLLLVVLEQPEQE